MNAARGDMSLLTIAYYPNSVAGTFSFLFFSRRSRCRASGFVPGDSVYVLDCDPAGGAGKPVLVLLKAKPRTHWPSTSWRRGTAFASLRRS